MATYSYINAAKIREHLYNSLSSTTSRGKHDPPPPDPPLPDPPLSDTVDSHTTKSEVEDDVTMTENTIKEEPPVVDVRELKRAERKAKREAKKKPLKKNVEVTEDDASIIAEMEETITGESKVLYENVEFGINDDKAYAPLLSGDRQVWNTPSNKKDDSVIEVPDYKSKRNRRQRLETKTDVMETGA